ncbi:MAG: DNA polymerase IV [Symbiobacteriia bacterium]
MLSIVHCDMDAFFASVEQRDNPELRGKPVVVGGNPDSRGVVSTASYEARRFGVHSAMPSRQARRLCPEAIFVRPNFDKYQRASDQIRRIMQQFTDRVEPLSLDEAFLDIGNQDGVQVGRQLKETIRRELNLAASVGVSYNKFLAKLGSDWNKPDGFMVIDEYRAAELLPSLPVRRLWGVGERTEELLESLGIHTVADLLQAGEKTLGPILGRRAQELLLLARGVDYRPVEPEQETKSVGAETTFDVDQARLDALLEVVREYADDLATRLRLERLKARTVTVKLRYSNFHNQSRSLTLAEPSDDPLALYAAAEDLLARLTVDAEHRVRLVGLQVSNFLRPGDPMQLFLSV